MLFSTCTPESSILNANEPFDGDEQNPPNWPKSVTIIGKDMTDEDAQKVLTKLEDSRDATTKAFVPTEHFSSERKVIFFEPRNEPYQVDVQVGYYVQVAGLGASASDVIFANSPEGYGPYCPAYNHTGWEADTVGSSLDTFWRSAENFTNNTANGILWAVSQAAPLRRVHAMNDLNLCQGGAFASGGHLANAQVDGKLVFGPQQQFCSKSVTIGSEGTIVPGSWANVYVDCIAPKSVNLSNQPGTKTEDENGRIIYGPSTTVNTPTITVEKCFLAMENTDSKNFVLHVPQPRVRSGDDPIPLGADLSGNNDNVRQFDRVYVAKACVDDSGEETDYDVARKINKALRQDKDVVLSPGIYYLKESIYINNDNQVLLGIGMATLVAPTTGEPCIRVAPRTEGVRIGGIMFEASSIRKGFFFPPKVTSFIEFGKHGVSDPGNPSNPGVLTDIFCRVGGSNPDRGVSTDVMVRIHSGNVLGDNLWLWRADHVKLGDGGLPNFPDMGLEYHQTVLGEVPVKTGLEVNGDNVVIHGLAVEHTTQDQVVWNGDHGQVYFYQCELPYDVDQDFGTKNYVGFRVTGKNHQLGGAGVYTNFRDFNVLVKCALVHPNAFDDKQVINPFIVHLNNQGRIMTVVSDGTELGGGPVYDNKHPGPMLARFPTIPTLNKNDTLVK